MTTVSREHEQQLIDTLRAARITEERWDNGEISISLAHLRGYVRFCDGVMYWGISGHQIGGEKHVDQADIDRSGDALENYGRKAVRNELTKIANRVIRDTQRRLEA